MSDYIIKNRIKNPEIYYPFAVCLQPELKRLLFSQIEYG